MTNTRADDKILGFEYQFYYFLLRLLSIQKNEVIGFEVLDDVHIEEGDKKSLIQLKHTRRTNTSGAPVNLVTSEVDLWKTIAIWIDLITLESDKNKFIDQTEFLFITNKGVDSKNIIYQAVLDLQQDNNTTEFKTTIKDYGKGLDKKNPIKKFCKKIESLNKTLTSKFIKKIEFHFSLNQIIEDIKSTIRYDKSIPVAWVDSTFYELTGLLKEDFFEMVKSRKDFEFTRDEFYLKTISVFQKSREGKLPFETISISSNSGALSEISSKQLLDIGFDQEKIFEANYCRLLLETNLNNFESKSIISRNDINDLDRNSIQTWKEEFEDIYLDEVYDNKTAKKLYFTLLKRNMYLLGQEIDWREVVKGQFIKMSNIPTLGWLSNWEEKYK
ncbi:MAG: hypothetical protein HRT88_11205 [Lentisphaeraceae bacterium]|nr:hypothetical protein [Lentisphaeraceae bacterium]